MGKHTILVEDDQDALLTQLIASGQFQDVSDAVRAALRLLEDDEARSTALRSRLAAGYDEAVRGEFTPGTGEDAVHAAFEEARRRRA